MDFDGSNVEEFYKLDDLSNAIFGLEFKDNSIYYSTTELDLYGNSSTQTLKANQLKLEDGEDIQTHVYDKSVYLEFDE